MNCEYFGSDEQNIKNLTLISIQENEQEVMRKSHNRHLTGVACPNCDVELQFIIDGILISSPPQKHVKCYQCNYIGTISVHIIK